MKPVSLLPAGYIARGRLDLSQDKGLQVGLTLAGFGLFLVFGVLFLAAAASLTPGLPSSGRVVLEPAGLLILLVGALAVALVVAVLHELTHAAVFWLVTHEWPVFGFRGLYAYAAAPKWYIPRLPYLLVGLAPLLLLTLVGLALLPALPPSAVPAVVFALTINAAGAVGDLYLVFRLLLLPATCLVHDEGNSVTWYVPAENGRAAED